MAIPESFRAKYQLGPDQSSYDKEKVEAAVSDLFAVSKRLAEDNEAKKRTLEQLNKDYSSVSFKAETLDSEVRRLGYELDDTKRRNSFLEAENRALNEKLDNMKKYGGAGSVSMTAAIEKLTDTVNELILTNRDMACQINDLEARFDDLVGGFYGSVRTPSETPAEYVQKEEPAAEPEIEIELTEIPAEETAAEEQVVEETAAAETAEEPAAEPEIEIELTEIPAEETAAEEAPAVEETAAAETAEEPAAEPEIEIELSEIPAVEETVAEDTAAIEETVEEEAPAVEETVEEEAPAVEETVADDTPAMEERVAEEPAEKKTADDTSELLSRLRRELEKQDETAAQQNAEKDNMPEAPQEDRKMSSIMNRLSAIRKKIEDNNN